MLQRIEPMDLPRAIWKFPLQMAADQLISMPLSSQILCVQLQGNVPCLWAVCAPDAEAGRGNRRIVIRGTGHAFDGNDWGAYIGTVQTGAYVWHVFDMWWAA